MEIVWSYTYQTIDYGLVIANVATKTAVAEVWNATADVFQSSMSTWLSNKYVKSWWIDERKGKRHGNSREPTYSNSLVTSPHRNKTDKFARGGADANTWKNVSPPSSPTTWRVKKSRGNLDRVHKHENVTTGLLEDLQVSVLVVVDKPFEAFRRINRSVYNDMLEISSYRVENVFDKIKPGTVPNTCLHVLEEVSAAMHNMATSLATGSIVESLFDIKRVDKRTHEQMVICAGYPFVSYDVVTDDGYIIKLERIPRYGAEKSVFLQHGVSDNAATFISSGTVGSLAYRLYDQGYDVWLGNFRGTDEDPKHVDNLRPTEYWNFNPNHHALIDIPSCLESIRHTQEVEKAALGGRSTDKRTLTLVAHSMGAACALMWATHARMNNRNHFLDKMVVMAPAGYHAKIPFLGRIFGPIMYTILPHLTFLHVLKWPNEVSRILVAKASEDIIAAKPFRRFMSLFLESLLGTPHTYEHYAFDAVHNFTFNTLTGTPKGVFYFFWNNYRQQRFLGYDYGPEGNLDEYGSEEPTDWMDNYDAIDIPTFFVIGLGDNLIYPENVAWQYYALKRFHPELAHLKAVDSGHIDFTNIFMKARKMTKDAQRRSRLCQLPSITPATK
eukprot:CFRG1458T1